MTFSIVALDPTTKALGVATATGNPYVGNRVPHIKKAVGAIATQGLTNISYGINGLKLLEAGLPPLEILKKLLQHDPKRDYRQVIIIDIHGRKAAFTGKRNIDYKGHIIGKNYIVAGNLLARRNVLNEMAKAFEKQRRFVEKLLSALEAGRKAGGDIRGERSTALIVIPYKNDKPIDLRVNDHPNPIKELRRIFEGK